MAVVASSAWATTLNVSVSSGGNSSVIVAPGAMVNYQVTGMLSDEVNEGLALVLFDLSFDGGALAPGAAPGSAPMSNFVRPLGVTNPNGYGGTAVSGALVQCGGAQNTIKNTVGNAPFPTGTVIPGVAWPSGPLTTLMSGSVTAPMTPGPYTLSVSNVAASVIRDGEDGAGAFWAVDLAPAGTLQHLSIAVSAVPVDPIVDAAGPRYLAVNLGSRTDAFALLVKPVCAGSTAKYVGTPVGVNQVARLVNNPGDAAYLTPTQWNATGNTIYITGVDIVPAQTYDMQADIGTSGNPNLLAAVSTTTWNWGDVNDTNVIDVDDILCALDAFAGFFGQCSRYATDLMGYDPNELNDVDDILAVLDAFQSVGYSGTSPCP